jgi:hypothetical protein
MMSAGVAHRPRASSQNGYDTTWHYAGPWSAIQSTPAVECRTPASQKPNGYDTTWRYADWRYADWRYAGLPTNTLHDKHLYVEIVEICQREDEAPQRE